MYKKSSVKEMFRICKAMIRAYRQGKGGVYKVVYYTDFCGVTHPVFVHAVSLANLGELVPMLERTYGIAFAKDKYAEEEA